ncbi:LexA family protein [Arthrobacter sp. W4I7]|uniref:LexA family protein n=1 Tax=Arthrobacter sp. W4I7 TaxID=3042296 RepID=UPI00358ECE22
MERAGISDGDELIVNRAMEPSDGSVVVAVLDGELTVKRLRITLWVWPRGACTMCNVRSSGQREFSGSARREADLGRCPLSPIPRAPLIAGVRSHAGAGS